MKSKSNRQYIQIILIFIGLGLIFTTYFFYPSINKSKLTNSVIENEEDNKKVENNIENEFENVEYKGFYNFDKPFIIVSERANILKDDPNIVHMINMKFTLKMNDGRVVVITGDEGRYNKTTYDSFFQNNVKATDGETEIYSDNLDLLATQDSITIYNNVELFNESGSLKADKVDYNFEEKNYKISMFNDKKIKIKLIQ